MLKKIYHHFMHDHLYRNSIFLMASTLVLSVFGTLFWILITHRYPPESVGIATALISLMVLFSGMSDLGMSISVIRYLPRAANRNDIINLAFQITATAAIVITFVTLLVFYFFFPSFFPFEINFPFIFVFAIFVVFSSWDSIVDSVFVAYRATENTLAKNIVQGVLKLSFPFVFVFLGAEGIFASFSLAIVAGALFALSILIRKLKFFPIFSPKYSTFKKMARFSLGNYLAGLIYQAPALLLPLLIVHFLSPQDAAFYYIAVMILNVLIIIPIACSQTLLTEGSYDISFLKNNLVKCIKIIAVLLLPAIFIIFFFGNLILQVFGKSYELGSFQFLRLLSLSAVFMSVSLLGVAILRVQHKIRILIAANFFGCLLLLGSSFMVLSQGLVTLGYAWLVDQAIISVVFLVLIWLNVWPRKIIKYSPL